MSGQGELIHTDMGTRPMVRIRIRASADPGAVTANVVPQTGYTSYGIRPGHLSNPARSRPIVGTQSPGSYQMGAIDTPMQDKQEHEVVLKIFPGTLSYTWDPHARPHRN